MYDKKLLENKTALITGGGTGLGKEMARLFLAHGARVCIASRKTDILEQTVAELGGDVFYLPLDVRRPPAVEKTIDTLVEKWGRLDILVNNAAGNFVVPSEQLSPAGWKVVIDIALNGVYYCSHFAGRQMIKQKYGRILNIVATYAWTGNPGTVHSAAAKAGVVALTRSLAVEWAAYGIRVNAIAPGPFDTENATRNLWADPEAAEHLRNQIPLKRFAALQEVAEPAVWLCSDKADYINGEVLVIDAGLWLNRTMFDIERMQR